MSVIPSCETTIGCMNRKCFRLFLLGLLLFVPGVPASGADLLNHDFESGLVTNVGHGFLNWNEAVPGWRILEETNSIAYFDWNHAGRSWWVMLLHDIRPYGASTGPMQGDYSIQMKSGYASEYGVGATQWVDVSISSDPCVLSAEAQRISMLAEGAFSLYFNEHEIVMTNLSGYGHVGDVSAYAGQTGEFRIVCTENLLLVDDISVDVYRDEPPDAPPADRYVSPSGSHQYPYTNWITAATSIMAAVDVAVRGDVVFVTNATYLLSEPVVVTTGVTVQGVAGSPMAVLDGGGVTTCAILVGSNATLRGFYVTGGYGGFVDVAGVRAAGGVHAVEHSVVENCLIEGNVSTTVGGVYLQNSTIRYCTVVENYSTHGWPSGVLGWSGGEAINCVIWSNRPPGNATLDPDPNVAGLATSAPFSAFPQNESVGAVTSWI